MEHHDEQAKRWEELSSLYKAMRTRGLDAAFDISRFSAHLRLAVAKHFGAGDDAVYHYKYTLGHAPIADRSEQVKSAHDALVNTEEGWLTGIGVRLEIGPETYPKQIFIWPIYIKYDTQMRSMDLTSHIFKGEESVRHQTYQSDLERLAGRMSMD